MKARRFGKDKALHFIFSFLVTLAVYLGTGALVYAAGIALLLGICKEIHDDTHGGRWAWWDLAADGIGILLAAILAVLLSS